MWKKIQKCVKKITSDCTFLIFIFLCVILTVRVRSPAHLKMSVLCGVRLFTNIAGAGAVRKTHSAGAVVPLVQYVFFFYVNTYTIT